MADLTMHDLARRKAEIVWSLKSVCSGFRNNSASDINQVFTAMFPDSKIAKSFQSGPYKLNYICNFGLAPFLKTILKLKKSEHFDYYQSLIRPTYALKFVSYLLSETKPDSRG